MNPWVDIIIGAHITMVALWSSSFLLIVPKHSKD